MKTIAKRGGIYVRKSSRTNRIYYVVDNLAIIDGMKRVYFHSPNLGTHYQWSLDKFRKEMREL